MTKTEQKIPEIQLSGSQVLLVRLYRRAKQVEKRIKDKLEALKANLVSFHTGAFIAMEGDKKVLSVSLQDGKRSFDLDGFIAANPKLKAKADEFTKWGEAFYTVRLH